MSLPALSHSIGATERSLRILLERELGKEQIDFPSWTVLVFTAAAPLPVEEIALRHVAGHILPEESASHDAVARLVERGMLVQTTAGCIEHSAQGREMFAALSAKVNGITGMLYCDLPPADVEVTQRILLAIGQRVSQLLLSDNTLPSGK